MAKKQSGQKKKRVILVLIIAIVALAVLPSLVYLNIKSNDSTSTDNKNDSTNAPIDKRPDVDEEDTLTVDGKVTLMQDSCSIKTLDSDGNISHRGWICDSGSAVMVDNKVKIYTSSGGPGPGYFHVDTSNVSLGDTVSVKYVTDDIHGPSLNCSECSVVVTKKDATDRKTYLLSDNKKVLIHNEDKS